MNTIYTLLLVVITAIGSIYIGYNIPRIKALYRRLKTLRKRKYKWRNSRLELEQVLDLIEKRIQLFEMKDKHYLEQFDKIDNHDEALKQLVYQNIQLTEQLDNVAKTLAKRETNKKSMVRQQVREYLTELKK